MVQRKYALVFGVFFFCSMNFLFSEDMSQPITFDTLYPETYVSRVLKTMKQLYASMSCIKNNELRSGDCSLVDIIEIQSLSMVGALQELHRALEQGFVISWDHRLLIQKLWNSLKNLSQDEYVMRYLHR